MMWFTIITGSLLDWLKLDLACHLYMDATYQRTPGMIRCIIMFPYVQWRDEASFTLKKNPWIWVLLTEGFYFPSILADRSLNTAEMKQLFHRKYLELTPHPKDS